MTFLGGMVTRAVRTAIGVTPLVTARADDLDLKFSHNYNRLHVELAEGLLGTLSAH